MRILLAAIYPYVFLLLYLLIPFDSYVRALPNILIVILVVVFPFIVKKDDFKRLKSRPLALFAALVLFLVLNSWFSGRFAEDFNIITKVLIGLGLAILYIPVADIRKINSAVILSSLAAIVFSVYNFVLITDATGRFALGDSPQVVESLLIDRLYLGMLSVFSILISLQGIKKTFHPNNNYYLANILINLAFIVLIASKIALVALFVILLVRQFYGKRNIWKFGVAGLAIVGIAILFFVVREQKNDHLYQTEKYRNIPGFLENSMTYDLRAVVWQCAAKIAGEEGFTLGGIGFVTTERRLVECYATDISNLKKREKFIAEEYNTHNQFLDFYLGAGFIALLLFVLFLVSGFFSTRHFFFSIAMLLVLVVYSLVEDLFHRQIGAYYVGFILISLMAGSQRNTKIETSDSP